jgi:hypothetical protein
VRATTPVLPAAAIGFDALSRAPGAGFDITLRLLTPMTDTQTRAFVNAKERIQEIIVGDIPTFFVNVGASSTCGGVAISETVDDILILAEVGPKDGIGKTLAEAGPCYLRPSAPPFPVVGHMLFDVEDIGKLETDGMLETVILHEMMHVVGFGTVWTNSGYLAGGGTSDPYFTGMHARDYLARLNNGAVYAGTPVPVENSGGAGTQDAHWRKWVDASRSQPVFGRELMTGYISTGTSPPLSATTVGSLQDVGYAVDISKADPFDLAHPVALRASQLTIAEPPIFLGRDVRAEPPIYLGPDGSAISP